MSTLPKLALIPSGYKASKVYSVLPTNGNGDFTFSRAGNATRVNENGLIETVGSNVPRLDYSDSNCPSLLLEPQRTNEISNSIDFEGWQDLSGSEIVTNNNANAPDGTNTAATIEKTGSDNTTLRFYTGLTNYSTIRSASIYIKKLSGSPTVSFGITDTQDSIIPTDEWVRYTKDNVTPNDFGVPIFVDIEVSGVSGDKIAVWGAQLEAGSYSTSYIPTEGGTVTRIVDTCKLENFANIPTNYPFTVFVDMDVISNQTGFGFSIIDISTPNIYFSLGYSEVGSTNKFRFTNRSQGTSYSFNTTSTYGTNRYKIAIKFISSTNFKAFISGIEVADYTHTSSLFNTNINDILLGQLRAVSDIGTRNNVNNFMIFNEELSDAELISLTS